ncbi:hypothetical protein MM239_03455 [Belliella sp. DSM 111904]|uniref:Uncharacterized protein n=1 Tax=Belliella filtrata TaxID=2923435 RepID=A0ABS9UWA5_9BACT|nr:hypothetical protein [Belliella filtrata]MCH7408440.1 hypothetical protein [Belliella filtrata]
MKYREEIRGTVANIVRNEIGKAEASKIIKTESQKLTIEDQLKFNEVVAIELMGLPEGSYVRYRIKPSEFTA